MLTMTRLQSDSFLPSGAMLDPSHRSVTFGSLNDHSTTSVISPLSLPHAIHNLNFLDESTLTNLPSPNYSHSSSAAAPRSRQQFLSPRQSAPLPSIREQRSASLSPTRHRTRSSFMSPSLRPTSNSGVTSPQNQNSVTMDRREQERQNMEHTSLVNLLRRREQQVQKLSEKWQAERAFLETSRNEAEELFEEERKIMNDERMMWLGEREQLKEEVRQSKEDAEAWKQRAEAMAKERDLMAGYLKKLRRSPGDVHRTFDGAIDAAIGSIRGGGSDSPGTTSGSSSKLRTPSDGLSPGSRVPKAPSGQTMPESQPFIPLDPRMQGLSPGTRSPTSQQANIPSIDIQEVIPSLEGIRVKAGAVQKPTFTDGTLSPSSESKKLKADGHANQSESTRSRTMPAVTKEALQAPEASRLTMHAGHTPNHSMSLSRLHTVESTQDSTEVTNTASSSSHNSGAATPTHPVAESNHNQAPEQLSQDQPAESAVVPGADADQRHITVPVSDLDEQVNQVDEDPALKGPLFLRNLPAADEPFILELSERLTLVKDNNLSPTVLQNAFLDEPANPTVEPIADAGTGHDGPQDADGEETEGAEAEIPLKLKKTSNFGAPLGELGK
ncbi:hypothetical protein GGR52DRAFT_406688 [Hypoxylon sp. FL1284]|nr:hypothetical protein GGR52DRAFT_406688 [Hypoxylon sp. FL1284]